MVSGDALQQARASYEHQSWREAYESFSAADREGSLAAEDLDRLGACAHMLGNESESADVWAKAHHAYLAQGDAEHAAGCAFRVGFGLLAKGQIAHGSGWIARTRRVLDDAGIDSVVRGYLLLPDAIRASIGGEFSRAHELFSQALA